jgi:hypothetical protein
MAIAMATIMAAMITMATTTTRVTDPQRGQVRSKSGLA